ncbi:hypothetical protein Dimus_011151 [Dionaea muscipula]
MALRGYNQPVSDACLIILRMNTVSTSINLSCGEGAEEKNQVLEAIVKSEWSKALLDDQDQDKDICCILLALRDWRVKPASVPLGLSLPRSAQQAHLASTVDLVLLSRASPSLVLAVPFDAMRLILEGLFLSSMMDDGCDFVYEIFVA